VEDQPPHHHAEDEEALRAISSLVNKAMWALALAGLVFIPWTVMIIWEDFRYAPHPFLPLPRLDRDIIVALGYLIGMAEAARIRYDHGLLRALHGINAWAALVAYLVHEDVPLKFAILSAPLFGLYAALSPDD
jgi:hypothetical protein